MIRRATPDDATALSALARECFTQTFGHLYAAEDLAVFLDQAYSPTVLRAELEDPERATWLLFEDSPGSPSSEDEAGAGPLTHVPSDSPSTIKADERHDAADPDTARAGNGPLAHVPSDSPSTIKADERHDAADPDTARAGNGPLAHVPSDSPSTINADERHDTADPDTARAGEGAQASSPERSPIGYVTACPAHLPHPDVAPGDGEIQRLYILRGHQGGGRGTLLLRTALEWLEREGPRTLWIGVWSENYGAQRFYTRHGFEIVGEYSFMVGDHADREFITRRPARP